jgi:hypothetical protein
MEARVTAANMENARLGGVPAELHAQFAERRGRRSGEDMQPVRPRLHRPMHEDARPLQPQSSRGVALVAGARRVLPAALASLLVACREVRPHPLLSRQPDSSRPVPSRPVSSRVVSSRLVPSRLAPSRLAWSRVVSCGRV